MNIWDYNLTKLQAQPDFERFRIERLLNYGMDGEKITREELKKYWNQIKIPNETREFLKMFIEN
jgi:hypothetical protein